MDSVALIGASTHIRAVEMRALEGAQSSASMLLTGEAGVGKALLARAIHAHSARHAQPFVVIPCTGMPERLIESECFGHTRASFDGATRDYPGLPAFANGGTVLFEEVGNLSLRLQERLLWFLETAQVRIMAATTRPLSSRVDGSLREDLLSRLSTISIAIAPLRERHEDIEPLMQHFLAHFSERHQIPVPFLHPATVAQLKAYHWPGNARELRGLAERLILRKVSDVDPSALLAMLRPPAPVRPAFAISNAGVHQRSASSTADRLFAQMVDSHQSFWTAVHAPFVARTVTRDDLRAVIELGLRQVRGRYEDLVRLFNMPPADYKRFKAFLNSAECQLPFDDRHPDPDESRRPPGSRRTH